MADINNEVAEPLIDSIVSELEENANVDYTSTITLPELGTKVMKDADARGKLAEVITSTNKAIEEVVKLQASTEQLFNQDSILANAEIDLRDKQQILAESIVTILSNQRTLANAILNNGGSTSNFPEWYDQSNPTASVVPYNIYNTYISDGENIFGVWGRPSYSGSDESFVLGDFTVFNGNLDYEHVTSIKITNMPVINDTTDNNGKYYTLLTLTGLIFQRNK